MDLKRARSYVAAKLFEYTQVHRFHIELIDAPGLDGGEEQIARTVETQPLKVAGGGSYGEEPFCGERFECLLGGRNGGKEILMMVSQLRGSNHGSGMPLPGTAHGGWWGNAVWTKKMPPRASVMGKGA